MSSVTFLFALKGRRTECRSPRCRARPHSGQVSKRVAALGRTFDPEMPGRDCTETRDADERAATRSGGGREAAGGPGLSCGSCTRSEPAVLTVMRLREAAQAAETGAVTGAGLGRQNAPWEERLRRRRLCRQVQVRLGPRQGRSSRRCRGPAAEVPGAAAALALEETGPPAAAPTLRSPSHVRFHPARDSTGAPTSDEQSWKFPTTFRPR